MKWKNIFTLLLTFCLCCGLLSVCVYAAGGSEGEEALQTYVIDSVGTFYLPVGWSLDAGAVEEPLPMTYADFFCGDLHIHGSCFGADAYEAAGVPLPADVEEYSQRAGVRQGLPEGAEFAYDDFGSYYTEYTQEDGTVIYHVLKQGENCMGDVILTYPEGSELPEGIYRWISQAVIDAAAEGLQRYDAENVGVFYLPEGFEMELVTQEEPFTTYGVQFDNGDIHIGGFRTDAEGYAQAGVSLPTDVEEFGSRPGIRSHLPEDAVFDYDEYGNYYVQYVQDGTVIYNALKQGEEAMGNVEASWPEGTEGTEDVPFWLSLAVIS